MKTPKRQSIQSLSDTILKNGLLFFLTISLVFHVLLVFLSWDWNLEDDQVIPESSIVHCNLYNPPPPPAVEIVPLSPEMVAVTTEIESVPLPVEPPPIKSVVAPEVPDDYISLEQMLLKIAPTPYPKDHLKLYTQELWKIIKKHRRYPREASILGWEGEVVVFFTLDREGTLLDLVIPPGGGAEMEIFNQEALRAVRSAKSSFPPFPETVRENKLEFWLPISFITE